MKCYNSFGEMFRANGGDRSVFNGIAQTKVEWEDSMGNDHGPFYFRFSTNDPSENVLVGWSKDGKSYESMSSASQEVKDTMTKSGLEKVRQALDSAVVHFRKQDPNYDGTKVNSDLLVSKLKAYCDSKGIKVKWTDKNGKSVESKSTPQPNPPKTKKPKVMVSGVKVNKLGEDTIYKIGYDEHGVAKAVSFDDENNAHKETTFAKFIGDNFKAKTEKDPDYMDNLGSKELIAKLKRYSSDPHIAWFAGNLSRDELLKELKAKEETERITADRWSEYYKKTHSKEARGGFWKSLGKAMIGQ